MSNEIKFIKYLIDILREIDLEKNSIEDIREVLNFVAGKLEKYINVNEELQDKAIKYIKEKQKIQYKFALSHIECDDLLNILNGDK